MSYIQEKFIELHNNYKVNSIQALIDTSDFLINIPDILEEKKINFQYKMFEWIFIKKDVEVKIWLDKTMKILATDYKEDFPKF